MTFKPCWWLPSGHLQTCAASLALRPIIATTQEAIPLPDGDQLELYWLHSEQASLQAPIVLLLHGLEGSVSSHYIQGMLQQIKNHGWRGVMLHFRGSNGCVNALPEGYHAGKTSDLIAALNFIAGRYPEASCNAVGYSLGANVLLKFLGEYPEQTAIQNAVAVSPPFDLQASSRFMHQGINRLYERYFMKKLKRSISRKLAQGIPMPVDLDVLNQISHLREFDEYITAPLHGFTDAEDYYTRCSSHSFLRAIQTPTLIIHAEDDPMIPKATIPQAHQLSPAIQMEVYPHGGHVGFISGGRPGKLNYWLEQRIPQYFLANTDSMFKRGLLMRVPSAARTV